MSDDGDADVIAAAAEPDAPGLGVVSACIPPTAFIAVEFPGYVRNVDRATRMLGGEDGIAAALSSCSSQAATFLKLSFRPDDPTAHPLFGDHASTRALLLRVSRKRQTTTPPQPGSGHAGSQEAIGASTPSPPSVQIVAQVSSVYRFSGMADFQFLPLDPGRLERYKSSTEGQEQPLPVPEENFPVTAEPSGTAESMLVVPPVFAQSDVPMEYAFKQYKYQAPGTKGAAGKAIVQEVGFHIQTVPQPADPTAVPAAPHAAAGGAGGSAQDVAGAQQLPPGAAAEKLQSRVAALLEERPAWSLELLTARLHEGDALTPAEPDAAPAPAPAPAPAADITAPAAMASESTAAAATTAGPAVVGGPGPGPGGGKGRLKGAAEVGAFQLQRCLASLTYCFKAGPWRHLYIRRGYDPRQHPDSRRYQVLQYKLPAAWFQQLALTRAAAQKPEAQAAAAGTPEPAAPDGGAAAAPGAAQQQQQRRSQLERIAGFHELPTSSTTELQLADLEDDTVRRLLAGPPSDRCTEEDGWLSKEAAAQLQAAVDARFQQLIDKLSVPVQPSTAKATRRGGRKSKKDAAAAPAADAEPSGAAPMEVETAAAAAAVGAGAGPGAAEAVTPEAGAARGAAAAAGPVPGSSGAAGLGSAAAEANPRSFLTTLMEQMALQPSAAQGKDHGGDDNEEDGYKILDSGTDEDAEERGAGFVVPSGDTGLTQPQLPSPGPGLSPLARPGLPVMSPEDMQVDDEEEEEEEEEVEYYDEDADDDDERYYLGH